MGDKFNQFFAQYNGQAVEKEDASNKDQCFDLAFAWVDFINVPRETIRHFLAYQIWTLASDITKQYFDLIPNTPDGVPQVGDLVIFGTQVGVAGHVSIANGTGTTKAFESFDQNWSGQQFATTVRHTYGSSQGVLGWLRPKTSATMTLDGKVFENLVRKSTITDKIRQKLNVEDSETVMLAEVDKLIGYEDAVVQKDKQLSDAQATVTTLQSELRDLTESHEETTADNKKLKTDVEILQKKIDGQGTQIHDLSTKLDTLKEQTHLPILTGYKKILYDLFIRG